jgi:hypothetical protein
LNYRSLTTKLLFVFLAGCVGLALYDFLPATNRANGDTISEVMGGLPPIPILLIVLLVGLLVGHFWWENPLWRKLEFQRIQQWFALAPQRCALCRLESYGYTEGFIDAGAPWPEHACGDALAKCTRLPHDGPCNGLPCDYVLEKLAEQTK